MAADNKFLETLPVKQIIELIPKDLSTHTSTTSIVDDIDKCFNSPFMSKSLESLLQKKAWSSIGIVIADLHHATIIQAILTKLSKIFDKLKIPDDLITIFLATGYSGMFPSQELKNLLGKEVIIKFDVVNHDWRKSDTHEFLPTTEDQIPIYVNQKYLATEFRIVISEVYPDPYLGFTGGDHAIIPGIAGESTIFHLFTPENLEHPMVDFGSFKNNPISKSISQIVKHKILNPDFGINYVLVAEQKLGKILGGSPQSYGQVVDYWNQKVLFEIKAPQDLLFNSFREVDTPIKDWKQQYSGMLFPLILYGSECLCELGVIIFERDIYTTEEINFLQLLFKTTEDISSIHQKFLSHTIRQKNSWQMQKILHFLQMHIIIFVNSSGWEESEAIKMNEAHLNVVCARNREDALKFCNTLGKTQWNIMIINEQSILVPIKGKK
jgi:hypothetical protein